MLAGAHALPYFLMQHEATTESTEFLRRAAIYVPVHVTCTVVVFSVTECRPAASSTSTRRRVQHTEFCGGSLIRAARGGILPRGRTAITCAIRVGRRTDACWERQQSRGLAQDLERALEH